MKMNKFLKMLVLSVAVVGSMSTTAFAAPPGYNFNGDKIDSTGKVIQTQKEILERQEKSVNVSMSRDKDSESSRELNPKTGQQDCRYTKEDGTPYIGLHKVANSRSIWYMLDETGFGINNGYLNKNGLIYRTDNDGVMMTSLPNKTSNGRWFYLSGERENDAPVCFTNAWFKLVKDSNTWHYFGSDGLDLTNSWIAEGSDWYYVDADGRMVTNTTINGYAIGADGKWIP